MLALTAMLLSACAPGPSTDLPDSSVPVETTTTSSTTTMSTTTSTTMTTTTTTTTIPLPASIDVVLSQPSPGDGTTLISGQVAPVEYLLTVENSGDAPSGQVVVTDRVDAPTTLVEQSASCGTTPNCTVEVTGSDIAWTIDEVAPRTTHALTFAASVDQELHRITSVSNTAAFTNVGTPGCVTATCTTARVTNPTEEFAITRGWVSPWNSVYWIGVNHFTANGWSTNDPAAEITYKWDCSPRHSCERLTDAYGRQVSFEFHWDDVENENWLLVLQATATQGERTLTETYLLPFRLDR